ncbi:DUF2079 domain-containing protein [Candidatus Daviesbacteria bacterium]|nr:DUF2079 domain-containing protein [Candidatus Daviesbacteria bacterium]
MFKKLILFTHSPYLAVILLSVLFILIYSVHSINRHLNFNSHALDLGIFTQATYLYSQGELPYSTFKKMVILGDHFDPILFFISPLYKLFPSPVFLLFLQSLFTGLSIIPLYFVAKDKIKNQILSLLLVVIYATSPLLLRAVNFDFHPGTMSLLPLSLLLYSWHFKKTYLYWFSFLLCFLFKEEAAFYIFGIGVYQLFQKEFRLGVSTMFLSSLLFYLIKFVLMPFFWPSAQDGYIQTSNLPLTNPLDMLSLLISRPDILISQMTNSSIKLATLDETFKQFAYFPVLSPFAFVTILPFLYLRFSSNLIYLWGSEFHNNAIFLPFLLIGTVMVITRFNLSKRFSYLFLFTFFVINLISTNFMFFNVLNSLQIKSSDYNYINKSINDLPKDSPISAQTTIAPHLANRKTIFMFPEIGNAEYVVLDSNLDSYPISKVDLVKRIKFLENSPSYIVYKRQGSLIIFQKLASRGEK